jgi:hypothetical protein
MFAINELLRKPVNAPVAELILSDGRFATLFTVRAGHLAMLKHGPAIQPYELLTLTVLIDDAPVTLQDVMDMSIKDFNLIAGRLFK